MRRRVAQFPPFRCIAMAFKTSSDETLSTLPDLEPEFAFHFAGCRRGPERPARIPLLGYRGHGHFLLFRQHPKRVSERRSKASSISTLPSQRTRCKRRTWSEPGRSPGWAACGSSRQAGHRAFQNSIGIAKALELTRTKHNSPTEALDHADGLEQCVLFKGRAGGKSQPLKPAEGDPRTRGKKSQS